MKQNLQSEEYQRKRAKAVKTAWLLGFVALVIFMTFIGTVFVGR